MDDYIRREELKTKIRAAFPSLEDRCRINEIVNSIPAAEVKPVVHGYWWTYQDEDTDCNGNLLVWCSECDAEDHHVPGKKVPFCWHCGAEMSDEAKRLWEPPNCGADMREEPNDNQR